MYAVAGERRSKRVRRGKAAVTVSALNTLWDLKLRILEALSVHPRNADVYCLASGKWTKLDNDDASLAGALPSRAQGGARSVPRNRLGGPTDGAPAVVSTAGPTADILRWC